MGSRWNAEGNQNDNWGDFPNQYDWFAVQGDLDDFIFYDPQGIDEPFPSDQRDTLD